MIVAAGLVAVVTAVVPHPTGREEIKMKRKWLLCIAVLISFFLLAIPQRVQAEVPDRPLDSTVLDESAYLADQTIREIDEKNHLWANTDEQLQVGVYIVEHIPDNSDLESMANETFRKWQVGFAGTDNGVLLYIAIEDRQFRIETSDNASTRVTDSEAKRILESARPFFRAEEYSDGVSYIVSAIGDHFYRTDQAATILEEADLPTEEKSSLVWYIITSILNFAASDTGFQLIIYIVVIYFLFTNKGGSDGDSGHWGGGGSSRGGWSSRGSSGGRSSGGRSGGGWSGGGGGGGGASSGW